MSRTEWLNRSLYPFEDRFLEVDGQTLHYVDEGEGPVLVMVHGTPTWSFLFRELVAELSRDHRVIALDHLGFGLSERPEAGGYRPEDHARRLRALVERLGLDDITLVVHDFGGPIGLSYALDRPDNVRGLVLFNTWMWSLEDNRAARMASRLADTAIGRFLYVRLNFSARTLIPAVMGDRRKLAKEVHRHYVAPFPTPADRVGPWHLARALTGSTEWYADLWGRRERIAAKPALLLWGMKDPTFGEDSLSRWRELLPHAEVREFAEAGHFVMEEAAGVASEVRSFLAEAEAARRG